MSAHRYWRVRPTSLHNGSTPVYIVELEFRGAVGGPDLTMPGSGGTAISSSVSGGNIPWYGPENAFDNAGAYFKSDIGTPDAWVGWDFGSGVAHDIIEVVMTNQGGISADYLPKDSVLEKSDDGISWSVYSLMPGMPYGNAATKTFEYSPPSTATIYLSAPFAPTMLLLGGGSASLSPPTYLKGYGGASAKITAPAARIFVTSGGTLSLALPRQKLFSTGHNSAGENAFTYTAPKPILNAFGGANARLSLPRWGLSVTAAFANLGKAALTAPSPKLSASGTVSGMASATLASPSPNLVGYGGAVCSITITGKATLTATGTTGSIGGAALSCPLFELTASATAQNHGSANLLAPSPRMGASAQAWLIAPSAQLTSIGSAVITATYEAYAVNLGHRNPQATTNEVTRYTNFPFTHVVRYQNSYYGANSTGLYLLEGTTDEATPIPWSFKTGITDFDDAKQKTVAAAYFGGSMPPATTVTLFEGDKVGVPYAQTTPRGADLQNYRETFARGIKGRYYALGVTGSGDIELDDLDFEIKQLTRRI